MIVRVMLNPSDFARDKISGNISDLNLQTLSNLSQNQYQYHQQQHNGNVDEMRRRSQLAALGWR